jgi:hypothetical protein
MRDRNDHSRLSIHAAGGSDCADRDKALRRGREHRHGQPDVHAEWTLTIPANAVASATAYTSTWTFSLVNGP